MGWHALSDGSDANGTLDDSNTNEHAPDQVHAVLTDGILFASASRRTPVCGNHQSAFAALKSPEAIIPGPGVWPDRVIADHTSQNPCEQ